MTSVLDDPGIDVARLSVDQYHQMIACGVLSQGDRLELFEGVLVEKMTGGPAHAAHVSMLADLLRGRVDRDMWMVREQHPITTADSEPEPDIAVVARSDYSSAHPAGSQIAAVIEVADSSLPRDRSTKVRIYAAAGISTYVIIGLVNRTVQLFRSPVTGTDPHYSTEAQLTSGPVDLGPVSIDAADLLSPT